MVLVMNTREQNRSTCAESSLEKLRLIVLVDWVNYIMDPDYIIIFHLRYYIPNFLNRTPLKLQNPYTDSIS